MTATAACASGIPSASSALGLCNRAWYHDRENRRPDEDGRRTVYESEGDGMKPGSPVKQDMGWCPEGKPAATGDSMSFKGPFRHVTACVEKSGHNRKDPHPFHKGTPAAPYRSGYVLFTALSTLFFRNSLVRVHPDLLVGAENGMHSDIR